MKNYISLFVLLVSVPLLSQCASQSDINTLNYKLAVLDKRIKEMEKNTVDKLQKRQAASSGQIDQLHSEVLNLKSQLEETSHLNRRLKEQNKELENQFKTYAELEAQKRQEEFERIQEQQREKEQALIELKSRLQQQQESVKAIQMARVKEAERKALEAQKRAAEAKRKADLAKRKTGAITIKADKKKVKHSVRVSDKATQTTTAQAQKKTSTQKPVQTTTADSSTMAKANSLFKKGSYLEAMKIYRSQIEKSPGSDEAHLATFMIGECNYNLKQYDIAILEYQKIIANVPDHEKAAQARYKQGLSFEKLKDFDTAKLMFEKVVANYGSSPEAKLAQEKLNKM